MYLERNNDPESIAFKVFEKNLFPLAWYLNAIIHKALTFLLDLLYGRIDVVQLPILRNARVTTCLEN